jgi:hypothetical protein
VTYSHLNEQCRTARTQACPLQEAGLRLAPEAELHRGDRVEPIKWVRGLKYALAGRIDRSVRQLLKYPDRSATHRMLSVILMPLYPKIASDQATN